MHGHVNVKYQEGAEVNFWHLYLRLVYLFRSGLEIIVQRRFTKKK
jgi:hypothetical protein